MRYYPNLDLLRFYAALCVLIAHVPDFAAQQGVAPVHMPLLDALRLTLTTADGGERWFDVLWSEQTPDTYYALPFANTVAYADANGEHMGTHPCAAFTLTAAQFARLLAALG